MSTPDNPYTPPTAALDIEPGTRFASTAEVPASVVALLTQTRPWVKLISVLFFVFLGLMVVAAVVASAIGPAGAGKSPMLALIPMTLILLLYIWPSLYLWRYARGIRRLQGGGGLGALEEALANQKSFWKFTGVLAVIMMCIYAIALVGGGLAGMFASTHTGAG